MTNRTKRYTSTLIAVILSILLFTTVPVFPQTVAEAARQERERKKTAHPLHVYTNEDLAKANILVPEDEARAARTKGSDLAEAASVAPGATLGPASETAPAATNPAIPRPFAAATINAKDRKEAAASVIAATPNVQMIDSYSGPSLVAPAVAATQPPFPAEANASAPLFTRKGQIALPELNLPQVTPDAYPFFDARWTINFPGEAEGNVIPLRTSSPLPATATAPPLPGTGEAPLAIVPVGHPSLAVPNESAVTAGVKPKQAAAAMASEAPAMPALIAPVGMPPADAPVETPVALQPKFDNPIQSPGPAFQNGTRAVMVQPGDSLWKLAERYLGDAERWRELAKMNPQLANPSLIHPGDPIHLPSLPLPGTLRGDLKSVVVRRGDTLWRVAQAEFGQPLGLHCIAKANQLSSVDRIRAGQTLVLPGECGVSK